MNLTDEQKAVVKVWLEEGAALSDVQRRLKDELGVSVTYLDVRFLVDDLKVALKEEPKVSEEETMKSAEALLEVQPPAGAASGVKVTLDTITKPHALVSGKVSFSDGQTADWMLDQTGRLGLHPTQEGYRPSQEDIMAFQTELQRVAQGFA